ncbi:hypothetical protein [Clostridium botulinum]|uniref:hypothetical protein n=1 Tax=Clostridium botulinum TaxID=1491 RepID=UPI00249F0BD1|nr:hypothetical protein [Clostridium botulinum]MDU4596441.1 hypothetical protein [Clostridium sporogenes]WGZ48078.1 hypothetical protein HEQ52_18190 [Clostridium botulinum]
MWHTKRIRYPSEYWNAKQGDKLVLNAFVDKELEDSLRKKKDLKRNEVPVFSVDIV